jgi:hypothetical protein
MKGSAGIDGLSRSAKGKGLMVRSPFLQRGVSSELFGGCGPGEWLAEKRYGLAAHPSRESGFVLCPICVIRRPLHVRLR